MIEIMTASAGSGKTYNLAKNYIRRLLEKADIPDTFRHILAVTFTNKAMGEMKSRIIGELYALSADPHSAEFSQHFSSLFSSPKELGEAAGTCLRNLLHDYSSFSVSTIDTFFQRILKAFSREIGKDASYQVELDRDSLIHESVDRILDNLTEDDSKLLDWLTEGVMNRLLEGETASVDKTLYDAASSLKSVEFRDAVDAIREDIPTFDPADAFTHDCIRKLEDKCRKIRKDYIKDLRDVSKEILAAITRSGLGPDDFKKCFYSQIVNNAELRVGDEVKLSNTAANILIEGKPPFKKNDVEKYAPFLGEDYWQAAARFRTIAANSEAFSAYVTAEAILGGLHDLGIAADLYRQFEELKKEKNVMDLTDSDSVLQDIINGSDTPFIYEKIGVRYEDFLLDEFQDTSTIQWENIRPLIAESQAHDSYWPSSRNPACNKPYSLIVGDVKQSIYRWRGSDWELLSSKLEEELGQYGIESSPLTGNFRSLANVVDFNNRFFGWASGVLDDYLESGTGNSDRVVSRIYGEKLLHQTCMAKKEAPQGNVEMLFVSQERMLQQTYDLIMDARQNRGANFGDIAVLVRKNRTGADVATYLIGKGVPVVSDESLLIRSSQLVCSLVAWLSFLNDRNDRISAYMLGEEELPEQDSSRSMIDECETYLRLAEEKTPGILKKETLYVQSFLDLVSDYVSRNGNNLGGFLEEWKDNKDSICSPSGSDAVRVITVHKSKGLEFPYVIYYYSVDKKPSSKNWVRACRNLREFPELDQNLFRISLSKDKTPSTPFGPTYVRETMLSCVDDINTFYVAFTRAQKCLSLLCAKENPMGKDSPAKNTPVRDFIKLLYCFASKPENGFTFDGTEGITRFRYGEEYDFRSERGESKAKAKIRPLPPAEALPYQLISIPLGKERLKPGSDAADFFSEDGHAGVDASERILGIVLHGILSNVEIPSDLDRAVMEAQLAGLLDSRHAEFYGQFLRERIASLADRGWFPAERQAVRNEAVLIDALGRKSRPDRIVETADGTIVVDYKFTAGEVMEADEKYIRQVERYKSQLRSLGHSKVKGFLWYVNQNRIFQVGD